MAYKILVKVTTWKEIVPEDRLVKNFLQRRKKRTAHIEKLYHEIQKLIGQWDTIEGSEEPVFPLEHKATIEVWETCCDEEEWDETEESTESGDQADHKRLIWDNVNGFQKHKKK
jgi:hypothetical protein